MFNFEKIKQRTFAGIYIATLFFLSSKWSSRFLCRIFTRKLQSQNRERDLMRFKIFVVTKTRRRVRINYANTGGCAHESHTSRNLVEIMSGHDCVELGAMLATREEELRDINVSSAMPEYSRDWSSRHVSRHCGYCDAWQFCEIAAKSVVWRHLSRREIFYGSPQAVFHKSQLSVTRRETNRRNYNPASSIIITKISYNTFDKLK